MKTIWAKEMQGIKNCNLAFALSKKVSNKNLNLSLVVLNVYRLYINGKLAGYGPARTGHGYVREDIYDLSSFITKDELTIVVEVFGSNVNNYYLADDLPFFGAEIKEGSNIIYSTENGDFETFILSDRVTKVQRYSYQRPFAEAYNMKKCRSNFYKGDFSLFPRVDAEFVKCNEIIKRYAPYPTFEKAEYVEISEQGIVSIDESLPKWEDRSFNISDILRGYPNEELEVSLSDEACAFTYKMDKEIVAKKTLDDLSYELFDFGRTLTGFFNLDIKVHRATTLYILWDEIDWYEEKKGEKEKNIFFLRNTCCNVIKYTLDKGDYKLLNFEPTSARFVKLLITTGEITINEFNMLKYENAEMYLLDFNSSDDKLNAIVAAAQNTLAQNAVDVLTDCPSRERAGWLCDSYFSAQAEKLMTGRNIIEKSFLENYVLAPQLKALPEGMLPMCYPGDFYNGIYIPNWAMWFVVELKFYLKRTGDLSIIEQSKEKVYKLIKFFDKYVNTDGLLEDLESWVFIEWSISTDPDFVKGVNYPSNMLYSMMLKVAGEIYKDKTLIERSEQVKQQIIKQSFNGEFFEDNKVHENGELVSLGHTTETCQYYAFFCGVAEKQSHGNLFNTLLKDFGPNRDSEKVYSNVHKSNAFIGNYLRLEMLLSYDLKEQVIAESKDFFYFMAERTGTLWEHSYIHRSLNHAFASIVANYIIRCVAGLVDIDFENKTVILTDPIKGYSATVKIPVPGGFVSINAADSEVNISLPEGYVTTQQS